MKKRILTGLLCLAMITGLTACAGSKPAQTGAETNAEVVDEKRSNVKETDAETSGN